jgi:hypothetical protein
MIRRNHSMQDHCRARPPPTRRGMQRRLSASSSSSSQPHVLINNNNSSSATTTPKRRMPSKSHQRIEDLLGGSLHSSLKNRGIQPRRMLRDPDVVLVGGGGGGGCSSSSPPQCGLLRQRSGSRRPRRRSSGSCSSTGSNSSTPVAGGGDYDYDFNDLLPTGGGPKHRRHHVPEESTSPPPPPISIHSSSPGREFRKLNHHHNADGTCCDAPPVTNITLWCYMRSNNRKKWILLKAAFWIVLGGALWMHSSHHVRVAHQALEASHLEKSDILSQMAWLDSRAKQNMKSVDNENNNNNNNNSEQQQQQKKKEVQYQRRIDAMEMHIRTLERTLQDSARERLKTSLVVLPPTVELTMGGAKEPLVIKLWYEEMPYTTLTWLDQIRMGMWTNANLQHVDNSWIDIHPTSTMTNSVDGAAASSSSSSRLAFMEGASENTIRGGDRRFVLGMRNPQGHENMFVLTIHLEVGTCESDENEVCFGELVGGFNELAEMDMENHLLTSVEIIKKKDQ